MTDTLIPTFPDADLAICERAGTIVLYDPDDADRGRWIQAAKADVLTVGRVSCE